MLTIAGGIVLGVIGLVLAFCLVYLIGGLVFDALQSDFHKPREPKVAAPKLQIMAVRQNEAATIIPAHIPGVTVEERINNYLRLRNSAPPAPCRTIRTSLKSPARTQPLQ